jgi:hypothetical protein
MYIFSLLLQGILKRIVVLRLGRPGSRWGNQGKANVIKLCKCGKVVRGSGSNKALHVLYFLNGFSIQKKYFDKEFNFAECVMELSPLHILYP